MSSKWLQSYLNDYAWRHNERHNIEQSMFEVLLDRAAIDMTEPEAIRGIRRVARRLQRAEHATAAHR